MAGAGAMVAVGLSLVALGPLPARGQTMAQPSGVTLVPAEGVACPPIVLPFGVASKYAVDRRAGLHDGIDFKLPEGTPLLAIAAGKVISIGAGARSAGDYLWLQHPPTETGLPFWVYSTYRHFDADEELEVGAAVKIGAVIGKSGRAAYPNFPLATLVSTGDKYDLHGKDVVVAGARLVDPSVVYVRGLGSIADLDRLPRDRQSVLMSYATADGAIRPEKARVIWPVPCRRR